MISVQQFFTGVLISVCTIVFSTVVAIWVSHKKAQVALELAENKRIDNMELQKLDIVDFNVHKKDNEDTIKRVHGRITVVEKEGEQRDGTMKDTVYEIKTSIEVIKTLIEKKEKT